MRTPRNVTALAIASAVLGVASATAAVVHRGDDTPALVASTPVIPDAQAPAVVDAPLTTATTAAPPAPARVAEPTAAQRAARLQRYPSCEAFVSAARREARARVGPYGLPGVYGHGFGGGGVPLAGRAATGTDSAASGGETQALSTGAGSTDGPGPGGFSGTNVQEQGIDEPDVVKTDGRRIFTLRQDRLWYATVVGGTARLDGSIDMQGARDFLLVGNRAVVFGYRHGGSDGGRLTSTVTVVDVRTSAMGVASSLVFEGRHVSARVVDGVVRAVVRSEPTGLRFTYPESHDGDDRAAAIERNRALVAAAPLATWVPPLVVEDGRRRVRSTRTLVDCGAVYHPRRFSGFGMLTVLTFDPGNPDGVRTASVHADGDRVYASRDRLYVATNGWQSVVGDGQVLPEPETLVHAFDISDPSQARYTSSGRVPGTTIGQFAFSEHEGHLRVATTRGELQGPAQSESFVTVLRDNGTVLETVGSVGGLGKGERIYAVRFLGAVGYVVTFRQVDPLYVVDLSNPRAPKVTGELKIEGYSAYLHPIGPGLLLGVGRDATPEGRALGVQVSVFDVSDPARPARLHHVALPGTGASAVEYDHHAFLWWAPTDLAVVPMWEYRDGRPWFGMLGLEATRAGLREVGRATHPNNGDYYGGTQRSLVVGSTLFTVSDAGIAAGDLATLAQRGWTPYPGGVAN